MTETPTIGFIGAGRMAAALAKGFVNAGLVSTEELIASDPVPAGREAFSRSVGCETTDSNAD
ncbi:MAG: NAD(P)-binding domain-containing protein, partial [Verrucomicrobiota bacterium]|nr:NAD(P)-binding domain-containing protein [Verrucomicrobiota bacterium]